MTLPPMILEAVYPLFDALPLDHAMSELLVRRPADEPALKLAWGIVDHPAISARPELVAGVWLYVDDLDASHKVSQGMSSQTGSFWHAIVHRREGDYDNALYWYRRVGHHPAFSKIPGFEPETLVEAAKSREPGAVSLQRKEWAALFEWCALSV